jgi:hypothetical protein
MTRPPSSSSSSPTRALDVQTMKNASAMLAPTVPRCVPLDLLEEEAEEPTLVIPRKQLPLRELPVVVTPTPPPIRRMVQPRRRCESSARRERMHTLRSIGHQDVTVHLDRPDRPLPPLAIDPFRRIGFSSSAPFHEPNAVKAALRSYAVVVAIALGLFALVMSPGMRNTLGDVSVALTR